MIAGAIIFSKHKNITNSFYLTSGIPRVDFHLLLRLHIILLILNNNLQSNPVSVSTGSSFGGPLVYKHIDPLGHCWQDEQPSGNCSRPPTHSVVNGITPTMKSAP